MSKLEIYHIVLGMVRTNCYILKNTDTRQALIVDPADEPENIKRAVSDADVEPVGILLTHGHYDHIMAVNQIKEQYGAVIYACAAEHEMLADANLNMSYSHPMGAVSVKADVELTDGQIFEAAGFSIQMLHTPGHTSGSCCYYIASEDVLISGDTLFCESVGRTDFPTGSTRQIIESLHRLLDTIPEETDVLPGHESTTTIAHEKRYNPFV